MTKFKKINSIFLTLIIVISSFQASFFITNANTIKIGYVKGSNVNVRADSSTKAASLDKVSYINTVIVGEKNDVNNVINPSTNNPYIWYQVNYTTSQKTVTGYIREDYITISITQMDSSFEDQLQLFPESYREQLKLLHSIYPNWNFIADNVGVSFYEAVNGQDQKQRKQVYYKSGSNLSHLSMGFGAYDWNTGKYVVTNSGWSQASTELIEHYMDPRNFLNDSQIYVFLKQQYDPAVQTKEGLNDIVKGTFLAGTYSDPADTYNNYVDVIMEAARQSLVSPYVIASTIIQEQGTDASTLSNGNAKYNGTTVYNFFNVNASGSTTQQVIDNGSAFAYNEGWFTRSASIIGGAIRYGKNYIAVGQDTYFYKNYNIINNPHDPWHQYAQNVADSVDSAKKLKNFYSKYTDLNLTFRIPVYTSIPTQIAALPAENTNKNNYYLSNISVAGLTPSFDRFNNEYSLAVNGDTSIYVELPTNATFEGTTLYNLQPGESKINLTVVSQSGYKRNYTINTSTSVASRVDIVFNKIPANPNPEAPQVVVNGDSNGNGKVTLTDLARVRLHLLGSLTLTGNNAVGADTNKDGKITLTDLARIRLHIIGSITLK